MEAGTLATSRNPWGVTMMKTLETTEPRSASEQTAYSRWFDQRSDRESARGDRAHGAEGVGIGRQAAGGELRRSRPRSRVRRRGAAIGRPGDRARVSRGDGALRRDAEHRRLVHAAERRRDRAAVLRQVTGKAKRRIEIDQAKARTKDSVRALAKLCRVVDGELRIVGNPPLITPIEDVMAGAEHLDAVIRRMLHTCAEPLSHERRELLERYRYVHAARKVVGVGSVGARAWILLLLGRDDGDPLFLQFKEARASVLEPFLGRGRFEQHGQRIVVGQGMMQAAADIMLGWERVEAIDGEIKDFYIRQVWDAKGSAEIELMNPAGLSAYGVICGWTLARAHARSGDAVAISAYLGAGDPFDRAMASFSETYADQNERDYQALVNAARSDRIAVQNGL